MAVKIDKGSALDNISLTPLIDIVFLLLIFFLVATEFAKEEREIPVQLPEASEALPMTQSPREVVINIKSDGEFYVSGKIVKLPDLEKMLEQAYNNNPGTVSAIIRSDELVPIKVVVAAINACKKAQIRDYTLAIAGAPN